MLYGWNDHKTLNSQGLENIEKKKYKASPPLFLIGYVGFKGCFFGTATMHFWFEAEKNNSWKKAITPLLHQAC